MNDEMKQAWAASTEKRPSKRGWVECQVPPQVLASAHYLAVSAWRCGPILVFSSLSIMEMPDGDGTGPQWLVTISADRKRPAQWQVDKVLKDFGMEGAEEDNHTPGRTRGFFLVCDPARRVACQCKSDEAVVVEPDGFTWSKDLSGKPCQGCIVADAFGFPCPEHGAKEAR